MIRLLGDVQNLAAKCVAERDGNVIEAVGEDQMEELTKAIEDLSTLPPSLSEKALENSINNWSTATQGNAEQQRRWWLVIYRSDTEF